MSNSVSKTNPYIGEIPKALMPNGFPSNRPRTIQEGKKWVKETSPSELQKISPLRALSSLLGIAGLGSFLIPSEDHSFSTILSIVGITSTVSTWLLEPDLNPDKNIISDSNSTPASKKKKTPDGTDIKPNPDDPEKDGTPRDTPLPEPLPIAPPSGTGLDTLSLEELIDRVQKMRNPIGKRLDAINEIIKRYPDLDIDQKETVVEAFVGTIKNGQAANDRHDRVRNRIIDKEQFSVLTTEPTERIIRLLINALEEDSIEPTFKTQIAYRIADIDKTKITLSAPTIGELKTKFDRLRETLEAKIIQEPLNAEAASQIPILTATLLKKDKIEDQELPKHIALLSIALRILTYPQTREEILPG